MMIRTIVILTLVPFLAMAQPKKKPAFNKRKMDKTQKSFLEKQWWIGIQAGPLLSSAQSTASYYLIQPTDYAPQLNQKSYNDYQDPGVQVSLEAGFYFKGFTVYTRPTYQKNTFSYQNSYQWISSTLPTNQLFLTYDHKVKLDYLSLPLGLRYEFTRTRLRPYIYAGVYMNFLVQAVKEIEISGTDLASGGTNEFQEEPISLGASPLFTSNFWGLTGGIGAAYTVGNVRLVLDLGYSQGMSTITSATNRYSSDTLAGVGDVMDDLELRSLHASVGCLFPLRFLTSGFKSTDTK